MEISQDQETAATLAATNPVIPRGLLVVESDTGLAKLGTGATRWNALPYWASAPAGEPEPVAWGDIEITPEEVDPEAVDLPAAILAALVSLGLVVESS